ncbi:MAG: (Fe-S)-binding protein [Negativicutes bacterium]|nr:(Fe-S)-binding protein [Negativicutes bacterium]
MAMEYKKLLADVEDAVANCMKCGNCQEVCPIYKEVRIEPAVARGKIALMEAVLNGGLDITAGFDKKMALCVSCKACTAKCPCGVKADELIIRGRQAAVAVRGLHPVKKAVFSLLKNRGLFDFSLRLAGMFGPLTFKKLPGRLAQISRFPMPGLDRKRITAPFAATPLRGQYPETVKAAQSKLRVGFFTGCTINYIYTDIGQSVINVLKANDIDVVLPKLQHCCGTPVYVNGDVELAKIFAKHNIETFENYKLDYIVAACGSCTEAWKTEYPGLFLDDPAMKQRADALAAKTYEISQFLVDIAKFRRDGLGEVKVSVTMHDPCHMARGIKVTSQPRELLKAIPGVEFIEMKDPSRCCGAGGSFSLAHYDLARQINDRKIADIASTGASIVATGCGLCRMHITDGLIQNDKPQEVLHTIQLLDKAYQARNK